MSDSESSDFATLLADYLEKSDQCRNFWKSAGLLAVLPGMWVGLRQDHAVLYKALCEQYDQLSALRSAGDPDIPPLPEKSDPFDLSS